LTLADQGCDLGLIGSGVMGRNFALNAAVCDFAAQSVHPQADTRLEKDEVVQQKVPHAKKR